MVEPGSSPMTLVLLVAAIGRTCPLPKNIYSLFFIEINNQLSKQKVTSK